MKKHNALKEARQGWEKFTKFLTIGAVGSFIVTAIVVLIVYY